VTNDGKIPQDGVLSLDQVVAYDGYDQCEKPTKKYMIGKLTPPASLWLGAAVRLLPPLYYLAVTAR
jgi:hypothetical protein